MQGFGSTGFDSIPPVVKNLLIINALFFVGTYSVGASLNINLSEYLGMFYIQSESFQPFQLITYMFMHANLTHIAFNMFALWMFGRVLETYWGPKKFLIYYLATGIGAALIQQIVHFVEAEMVLSHLTSNGVAIDTITQLMASGKYDTDWLSFISQDQLRSLFVTFSTPTVGASGAVFGLLLAFGMTFPNTELYMMFIPIPIKAKYFVAGYGAIELYSGFQNNPGDNVAHFAHIGGMLFGYILIRYWQSNPSKF